MRILITGSHGLIGSALIEELNRRGDSILTLVRRAPRSPDEMQWDADRAIMEPGRLEGLDAVVHLAGESIMGRWTPAKMEAIRRSRANGTRVVAEALAQLQSPPGVFVSASAIGYYGNRPNEILREGCPAGSGFLPDTTCEWEAATRPAQARGIRTVLLRLGIVLSTRGGALRTMLPAFRLGGAARFGDGRQYISWITLEDVIAAIVHVIAHKEISGPVNLVSPDPVTNADFTRQVAAAVHRPALLRIPASVLRVMMGAKMADEALLASARAEPARLLESGFKFRHPKFETAVRELIASNS